MTGSDALSHTAILAAARAQVAERGATGLSVRAVARRLGVTPPALYHWFPSLDDLITALVLESLAQLRAALARADTACPGDAAGDHVLAICRAYRAWALANPVDFQLAYAEPIPGYRPPEHVTGERAREPFLPLFHHFRAAHEAGLLRLPPGAEPVPSTVAAELAAWRAETGLAIPDPVLCLIVSGWARLHGLVTLELFGQTPGVVGDSAAFFDHDLRAFARTVGLPLTAGPSHSEEHP